MTPQDVIQHYGTQQKAAAQLGCKQPTIAGWLKAGRIPRGRQAEIQLLTGGLLVAENRNRKKRAP